MSEQRELAAKKLAHKAAVQTDAQVALAVEMYEARFGPTSDIANNAVLAAMIQSLAINAQAITDNPTMFG